MQENRFLLRQISIFLVNKPGALAEITGLLAEGGRNMRAFTLTETRDFGTVRIIVNNTEETCRVLEANHINYSLVDVVAVEVDDRPGGMHEVVSLLSRYQINIEYAYTTLNKGRQNAIVLFRANDTSKAVKVLRENGRHLLTEEEVTGL